MGRAYTKLFQGARCHGRVQRARKRRTGEEGMRVGEANSANSANSASSASRASRASNSASSHQTPSDATSRAARGTGKQDVYARARTSHWLGGGPAHDMTRACFLASLLQWLVLVCLGGGGQS